MKLPVRFERPWWTKSDTPVTARFTMVAGMTAILMFFTTTLVWALPPVKDDCEWVNQLYPSAAPFIDKFSTTAKVVGAVIVVIILGLLLIAGQSKKAPTFVKWGARTLFVLILFGGAAGLIFASFASGCTGVAPAPPAATATPAG